MDWVEGKDERSNVEKIAQLEHQLRDYEIELAGKEIIIENMVQELEFVHQELDRKKMHVKCLMKCLGGLLFAIFLWEFVLM